MNLIDPTWSEHLRQKRELRLRLATVQRKLVPYKSLISGKSAGTGDLAQVATLLAEVATILDTVIGDS